ncbi:hypothetical protein UCD39_19740 [Nitrospirillum sp. BR 11752]|uniref:Uncharacterized protein n=1 Tax=Nitrospirillum amazonense TaxID=28077 RepID=A0A560GJF8_9PROT|nr:hypothetical protein [Nitrospirillum amazonense]MEE3626187.1 hypothetical protein [Nitrospirillum sp. BR 11752]TWB34098.1 hypothetical protein FBZ90_12732 [Nitrospirillum amazonense]
MDGGVVSGLSSTESAGLETEAPSGSFARAYQEAHAAAGIQRLAVTPVLEMMDLTGDAHALDAYLARAHADLALTSDNVDRLKGNLHLVFLFRDFRHRLVRAMERMKDTGAGPFAALPEWMSAHHRFGLLRTAGCLGLNKELDLWMADLEARGAPQAPIACPFGRMARAAGRFFSASALYRRADHSVLSIAKTGSNTALHVCWSLVEAAYYLGVDLPPAEWRAMLWRSRKEIATLASGSLGMIVAFLEAAHLHPHGDSAVNPTTQEGSPFRLVGEGADRRLDLRLDGIAPVSTGHDRLFTGCPAFHVSGMIDTYLTWVLDIALHHGLNRQPAPAPALVPALGLTPVLGPSLLGATVPSLGAGRAMTQQVAAAPSRDP